MNGSHRRTSSPRVSRLLRAGLIASAGVATIAAATPATALPLPAQHPTTHVTGLPGTHVDLTSAISIATPRHPEATSVAFDVHQYGDSVGAGADNRAVATSTSCDGSAHCRSVALSFQIITMGGSHLQLHASNTSRATTVHCTACQAAAGAYQFILDTPRPVTLDATALAELDEVHRALDAAVRAGRPDTLKSTVDALAQQVTQILHDAAARMPAAATAGRSASADPGMLLAPAAPTVTVNHVSDGWR